MALKPFPKEKKNIISILPPGRSLFSPTPPGSQALVAVEAVHRFDGREGLPLPQDLARARRALVRQRADGDAFRRDLPEPRSPRASRAEKRRTSEVR